MTTRDPRYCIDIITDEPQRRHEWRQRFVPSRSERYYADRPAEFTTTLRPDGFYCIHCRAIEKEATE